MKQLGHLQEYTLTLTTKAPVFVGSGVVYGKMDYIFDAARQTVSFIDQTRFFQLLIDRDLIDKYESFILNKRPSDTIQYFLKNICKLDAKTINSLIVNRVSAADALDENHSLKEIQAFIRRADGRAYIPGSSLKGCLRTVLLTNMLLRDSNKAEPINIKQLESKYLHTLQITNKQSDMVNSIMRGISISDSEPIDEKSMILASKIDSLPDGFENRINVVRQCVAPETKITFRLTLDQNILSRANILTELREAIRAFDAFYIQEYNSYFAIKKEFEDLFRDDFIVLGGGSGFFAKNLIYPLYAPNHAKAVKTVSQSMQQKHKHEKDIGYGISPRTFKITEFDRFAYPIGLCQVTIQ
ncbi:type III-A CRISPR-associated RAMP protein Csm5 [Butyricicoccus intestinisimiae]|uniref:CRISPR system Cms protein Csm5 n=1 Tax=Butyricicoccus intestinisimiae TaxID=2841509 RepID=A0ABS6ENC5_9FIRM|nr:type III-A CRISPR-associated RAMP protein Csm5 [Butyricicoccus intestinisimiae]MBU5489199.1 type III-A CRISPR-associated RAMP protein Csm5 [Butyricicoccus intestinisimiae]